jgi:malic enzyme
MMVSRGTQTTTALHLMLEFALPKANDSRLRERVSQAVRQAAVDSGVARV